MADQVSATGAVVISAVTIGAVVTGAVGTGAAVLLADEVLALGCR